MSSARPRSASPAAGAPRKPHGGSRRLLVSFRAQDSEFGITRETLSRLAEALNLTETQVLHLAAAQLARRVLPAYAPDDGPLTEEQRQAIHELAPPGRMRDMESLF